MSTSTVPTFADVIERIGFGFAQVRYMLTGGGVWFADGSEVLLISAVTSAVATEWSLGPVERGSMVTIVYIGVLVGNLIAGPLADRRGRKQLLMWSYLCIFVFSILSSWTISFMMLCVVRFMVGLSFGLGQPAANALANEVTPAKWRVVVNTLFNMMWPLGEVYSALLVMTDDPGMHDLHWRRLLQLGAIPAMVFWIVSFFALPESPYWLAHSGKYEEAQQVLALMQHDNGMPSDSVEFVAPHPDAPDGEEVPIYTQFSRIWTGPLAATTLIMSYALLNINLLAYGSLYAFAQILPILTLPESKSSAGYSHTSAGSELLIGALWELPGFVIAILASVYMPRKLVIKVCLLVLFVSLLLFASGAEGGHGWVPTLAWHMGFYMIKCFISCTFVMCYLYIGEVYPTIVRSTGSSFNIAFGRIGAIIAPLLYELLEHWSGSFVFFFYLLAGTTLINIILIHCLPIETFNATLMNNMNDLEKYQDYGATTCQRKDDKDCTISSDYHIQNGG